MKVFENASATTPMTPQQLADAVNAITSNNPFKVEDFVLGPKSRLSGEHCDCGNDGEFILLPENDPVVVGGMKRYMQCRICGAYSHL